MSFIEFTFVLRLFRVLSRRGKKATSPMDSAHDHEEVKRLLIRSIAQPRILAVLTGAFSRENREDKKRTIIFKRLVSFETVN